MKTFIASDFHGMNPTGLVRALLDEGEISRAVFLGDYDEPEILRDIRKLEIDKIVLIGNHEYNLCRGEYLRSKYLVRTLEKYWEIWGDTPEGEFARECPLRIVEKDIAYLHGSLVGIKAEESPCEVWGRLHDEGYGFSDQRRLICNFREMKKAEYSIMFRGHDHESVVYFANRETYTQNFKQIGADIFDRVLDKDEMNLVSVGPFVEGEYCLFDDERRKLEFRNVRG
jgi:predicted phosphodiesterase